MIGIFKTRIIAMTVIISSQAAAGGISKFESRAPEIEGISQKNIYDIERCLVHMVRMTLPYIYRQPDRPDEVMMVWQSGDTSVGRADLKKENDGTHVRIWMGNNEVCACAAVSRKN